MAKSAFTSAIYNAAHAENDAADELFAMQITHENDLDVATCEIETAAAQTEADAMNLEMLTITPEDIAIIEALDTDDVEMDVLEEPENVVLDLQASGDRGTFEEMLAAITDEDAIVMAVLVGKAIDERQDFERAKGNDNIQKALAKSRKQLATPTAARVLIACAVDPSMINRSVHEGVRYNVYALGKLADAIHGLSGGAVNNAINLACMKSLFRFKAAGKDFTGEMAKAAASDKIKVDTGLKGMLVRHTVSASTSSTQASSTMQALTTLGIVSRAGSHKNPTFTLTDTAVVQKLQRVIGEVSLAA
jgi:hypothetical protein